MKRKVLLIPLIIFLAIAAALLWQLARNAEGDDPTNLESARSHGRLSTVHRMGQDRRRGLRQGMAEALCGTGLA